MVDLDPVSDEDAQTLKAMIEQHLQYTGSSVAKFVLNDFENQLQHFVKVFPKDYKKALQSKNKFSFTQGNKGCKVTKLCSVVYFVSSLRLCVKKNKFQWANQRAF
jgi:hypothetical protein